MNTSKFNLKPPLPESECVCTFACWWREMAELESAMEYRRSSAVARATWDSILSAQIPSPWPALAIELRASALIWQSVAERRPYSCGTLLERFVTVANEERLELPRLAVLAAFRLHRRLLGRVSRHAA